MREEKGRGGGAEGGEGGRRRREGELVEEGEEDEEFIDFNRFAIDASINLYSQLQQHAAS